jgi:hypothetical protein
LSSLQLDFPRYTFIDLGSGNGRIVLVAACLPFRRVVGVEFIKEFHEMALANLRRWPAPQILCGKITLMCEDAATFEFPPDPLVVYLFNPFGERSLAQVMTNLTASMRERPRDTADPLVNPKQKRRARNTRNSSPRKRQIPQRVSLCSGVNDTSLSGFQGSVNLFDRPRQR